MNSFSKEQVDMQGIAQKYISGTLSEEDVERFELYLMDNPEQVKTLELDMLIKNHANVVQTSSEKIAVASNASKWLTMMWPVSLATSFALAIGIFIGTTLEQSGQVVSTDNAIYYISPLRSADILPPLISVSKSTERVIFVMQLPLDEEKRYLVNITDSQRNVILSLPNTRQNFEGDIVLNVALNTLDKGNYMIDVLASEGLSVMQQPIEIID